MLDVVESVNKTGLAIIPCLKELGTILESSGFYRAVQASGKQGKPIFECMKLDGVGNFIEFDDGTDQLESDVGAGQRLQFDVQKGSTVLGKAQAIVEEYLNAFLKFYKKSKNVKIEDPAILYNKQAPGQAPVTRQSLHHDLDIDADGLVLICALEDGVPIVVTPYSHIAVEEVERLKTRFSEAKIASSLPPSVFGTPQRLVLKKGQLLFLGGHTVHAGDSGVPNSPSLRVHWYALAGKKKNATSMIQQFHPDLADRFLGSLP
ncbi:hypothetical protein TSOC_012063 [Tetrabaena socialis]|uniref:Phytanoyl-CoA dioxygenase domain-containing protein 1 n=1 Tax=Tetrabaena socialis TaxID=47790 RepID=A0A2J7ZNZ8_9CHLO|nr:hypothetical protein TSOC_012063 [Tetrabaena socialis]|eukprot:PNH01989.1 hypothetical protein TSOC_012063 [Tetrabaena socialis]